MGRATRVKHSAMFIAAALAATMSLTSTASAAQPSKPQPQTGGVILWIQSHHETRQNKQQSPQYQNAREGVDTGGVILWFKSVLGSR